jgi:miniconductance mechanosensitive channel
MDSLLSNFESFETNMPAWMAIVVGVVLVVVIASITDIVAKRLLIRGVARFTRNTSTDWDDYLVSHRVLHRLAQLPPALVVYYGFSVVPGLPAALVTIGRNVAMAYSVLIVALAISALLTAANEIYEQLPVAKDRPLKGFVQLAKIGIFVVSGVLIVAILIERSPVLLLSGLGAMTAVLMLIFKDTILSLVASIQLATLDMVRVGDWIEMPSCGADGDVIDIALHTVKVQNWDKTITTVPTHKLIAESFKNWRGMSESGGRRIKRSLFIDVSSIRFLDEAEVENFKRFALLREYVENKEDELTRYNEKVGDTSNENLRRLTNLGTFRAYVLSFLRNHPSIHQDLTLLVRQLQPGPHGLPLEIYAFTNVTDWNSYEAIQADIFDHLLAIIDEFGLRIYQQPSGQDIAELSSLPVT